MFDIYSPEVGFGFAGSALRSQVDFFHLLKSLVGFTLCSFAETFNKRGAELPLGLTPSPHTLSLSLVRAIVD